MTVRRWAWLIGMSDAADARLVDLGEELRDAAVARACSGARLDFDGYVPERRAIRLTVTDREVQITIKPGPSCVNPVFELDAVRRGRYRVTLGGQPLDAESLRLGRPDPLARCDDRDTDRACVSLSVVRRSQDTR